MTAIYPNTEELVNCIVLDLIPEYATKVDFGLDVTDPTERFGALQWAYKRELITKEELNEALGNGPLLTELAHRTCPKYGPNPYTCEFTTAWDNLEEEEEQNDEQ